jgi:outer membrane protein TolC
MTKTDVASFPGLRQALIGLAACLLWIGVAGGAPLLTEPRPGPSPASSPAPSAAPETRPEPAMPEDLTAPPEGVRALTLSEALREGLARNPRMKLAAERIVQARAAYEELGSAKNVKLGLTNTTIGQPQRSIDSHTIFPNGVLPPGFPDTLDVVNTLQNRLQLTLEALLTTFGRVENEMAALLVGISAATQQAATDQRELMLDVKKQYFMRLRAEATARVSEMNLASARQTLSDTEARFKQGILARYDVLQAQLDVSDATQRRDTAQSEMETSGVGLASVLFAGAGPPLWATALPPVTVDSGVTVESLRKLALGRRPDVQALSFDLKAAQRMLAAAKADNNPTLALSLNYYLNSGNNLLPADAKNAQLVFQWPIFDGGQRNARVRSAASTVRMTEDRMALLEQMVGEQVAQSWQRLQLSLQNLATAQERTEIAASYYFLARQRFVHGVGTSLEMQAALRSLNDARLALVLARNDVDVRFAEVEQSLGMDFPTRHLTLAPPQGAGSGGPSK